MSRARQPVPPAPSSAPADTKRLLLVPSDATGGEVLYERIAPVVQRMAWIYLATDPERDDITQDILLSVLRGAPSVKDPARLEAWAARVAFNTICNVFRRRKLLRWLSLDVLSSYEPPAPPVDFEGRDLVARAQKILERLPTSERMPFTMQLLGNAGAAEIAKLCGCSERTLRRRLSAARERFTRLVKLDPVLAGRLGEPTVAEEETSDG